MLVRDDLTPEQQSQIEEITIAACLEDVEQDQQYLRNIVADYVTRERTLGEQLDILSSDPDVCVQLLGFNPYVNL